MCNSTVSWFHCEWAETSKDYEERNYRTWIFSPKQYFGYVVPWRKKRTLGRIKDLVKATAVLQWGLMATWRIVDGKWWACGFIFQTGFSDRINVPWKRSGVEWLRASASITWRQTARLRWERWRACLGHSHHKLDLEHAEFETDGVSRSRLPAPYTAPDLGRVELEL